MFAANGSEIPILGSVNLKFTVGGQELSADFLVAEGIDEVILGFCFLKQYRCQWLFDEAALIINGEKCDLKHRPGKKNVHRDCVYIHACSCRQSRRRSLFTCCLCGDVRTSRLAHRIHLGFAHECDLRQVRNDNGETEDRVVRLQGEALARWLDRCRWNRRHYGVRAQDRRQRRQAFASVPPVSPASSVGVLQPEPEASLPTASAGVSGTGRCYITQQAGQSFCFVLGSVSRPASAPARARSEGVPGVSGLGPFSPPSLRPAAARGENRGRTPKWQNLYATTGEVVMRLNDATYVVQVDRGKKKIFHVDKLKLIV